MHSVHIREIAPGDILRISLKGFGGLNPTPFKVLKKANRSAKSFTRTVFVGRVQANDPTSGLITMSVQGMNRWLNESYSLSLAYKDILFAEKQINPGDINTPNPLRPGRVAFGYLNTYGFQKKAFVRF